MKNKLGISAVIIGLVALFLYAQTGTETKLPSVSPETVKQKIENKEDIVLLDVRTQPEYTGPLGHIEGSILIPVQVLEQRIDELEKYKDKEIIVYCRSGNRSRIGTQILLKAGYNAVNMLGGMRAWNKMNSKKK